jgi:hypothetical protein
MMMNLIMPSTMLNITYLCLTVREKDNGKHDPARINILDSEVDNHGSGKNSYFFDKLSFTYAVEIGVSEYCRKTY